MIGVFPWPFAPMGGLPEMFTQSWSFSGDRDWVEIEWRLRGVCSCLYCLSLWTQLFGICDVLSFKLAGESLNSSSPSCTPSSLPLLTPSILCAGSPSGFSNFNEFIGMTNAAKANSTESQCLGIDFTVGRGGWGLRPHSHCGLLSLSEGVAGCQEPHSLGFSASADSPALSPDRESILRMAEVSSEAWGLGEERV